ncbi:hypothetical protein BGW80DRAFT_75813 [Lactifluus volemus]|nr:hypothetical protein BGW80DRAFT_75813 [Lactifluus volemus]
MVGRSSRGGENVRVCQYSNSCWRRSNRPSIAGGHRCCVHAVTRSTTGTELEDPRYRDPELRDLPRDGPETGRREGQGQHPGQLPGDPSAGKESKITLSGLLNALDGISAQEGRLLFATTNRYHTPDPALTRPGRMDLHVEFRLASQYQAKELYRHFYAPDPPKKAMVDGDEDDALIAHGYAAQTRVDSGPMPTSSNGVLPTEAPKYNGIVHSARYQLEGKKSSSSLETDPRDVNGEFAGIPDDLQGAAV